MNYYYLLSGLPDLSLDVSLANIDFEETFDTIQRNLESEDLELFNYLLHPNDNRNFLSHLFYEYKELPKGAFQRPYTLTPEIILAYRRELSSFPDYMVAFIREFEAQFPTLTMREMENRLQEKFDDELNKLNNAFIKDYFLFKRSLAGIVAAFNQSNHSFLSESSFHNDPLLDSLKKGQAPSSTVLKTYPFAEQLKEVILTTDPTQIEHFIERIEWDYLAGPYPTFGSEQVLAYTAKLFILFRKKNQKIESGSLRFDALKNDIRNKVHSPKTPVL